MAKVAKKISAHDPMVEDDEVKVSAQETPAGQPSRVYKGTREVDHDLFKLSTEKMLKNVSYTEAPQIESFDHNHVFHTVDSNGRKMLVCSAVGGHVHECTVEQRGGVPVVVVGPPRKWVMNKRRGKKVRELAPVMLEKDGDNGEPTYDKHIHKVEYLGSERIKIREANVEFAKFESQIRAKQEPSIEGVS